MAQDVFHIAIDGPVAAGKGTVSLHLAKKLGFVYIETGAMYRTAAWLALQKGIALNDESAVVDELKKHTLDMQPVAGDQDRERATKVLIDGQDITLEIRSEEVSLAASKVAVLKTLRRELVKKQQELAKGKSVVMEGRDIAIRVLPKADLKIYLDAELETRVQRRHQQLKALGETLSYEEVKKHIVDRDTREMTREVDPLQPTPDAWILDTTNLTIAEVVDIICDRVTQIKAKKHE